MTIPTILGVSFPLEVTLTDPSGNPLTVNDALATIPDSSHSEAAAAIVADRGAMVLAVRKDAATAFGADGQYVWLTTDNLTRLRTRLSNNLTPNDISGTIATGGVAQAAVGANANRSYFWVYNESSADLRISELATAVNASPSIRVPPLQSFSFPPEAMPVGAISIIGATTGQAWTGREG